MNLFYFGEREGGLGENKIAGIQGLSAKAREYGEKRGLKDLCKGGGGEKKGRGGGSGRRKVVGEKTW